MKQLRLKTMRCPCWFHAEPNWITKWTDCITADRRHEQLAAILYRQSYTEQKASWVSNFDIVAV